jgi:hypothetical protein
MPLRRTVTLLPGLAIALLLACSDDTSSPAPHAARDIHPPEAIDDLGLAYDATANTVVFTWTAPRDDIAHPRADHYDLRYSGSFPLDWERSTRVTDPPLPLDDGTTQQFTLANPTRGRDLYASMHAVDAAGNESPAGAVAHLRVPGFSFEAVCVDALSNAPITGLDAVVTAQSAEHVITPGDGRITFNDLSGGTLGVLLSRGSASTAYHTFDDAFDLTADLSKEFPMIPFQQPVSLLYPSILALLKDAILSPGGERIIKRWFDYPVMWYARDFVSVYGVDYRALLVQAAERWNTRLGFQMFAPAPADPTTGILVEFLPRSTMGTVNGITEYTADANGYPVHDRIRIVDDITDQPRLYSIFMHELGHTIPLVHLPAGFIMFAGQPLPPDISDDEVAMVQLLLALPNGTHLSTFDSTPPAP